MVMCVSESIVQWLNLFLAVSAEREKDLECTIMLIFCGHCIEVKGKSFG